MELLYTAIEAALKAGREILAIYEDPNADFHVERKADNSPLTIADRRSHDVIAAAMGCIVSESDTGYGSGEISVYGPVSLLRRIPQGGRL